MKFANPITSLHFRITAAFVVLLVVAGGAYYLWGQSHLYSAYDDAEEEYWYKELAAAEMDSLAGRIAVDIDDTAGARVLLEAYGRGVADYEAEFIVFDANGRSVCASSSDSLCAAVPDVDPELLLDMSGDDWDFGSYPIPGDISAYENRIFEVRRLIPGADREAAPAGYLVASFAPPTIAIAEIEEGERKLGLHAALLLLLYAAASSTIIMLWTTRRLGRLSSGVEAFTAGDLSARVPGTSADEIGGLGRNINAMAERIEHMVTELRQKESFQRQLVANVSHDLRTPLANLRGYVETLSMGGIDVGELERKRYLAVITEKLDHLDRLIEHVLVLSRMDSGQAVIHREAFSPGELVDAVLDRCQVPASDRGVRLDLVLDGDLPDVDADPLQIGRVLQNLVENGIKFTPPGGSVVVSAVRAGAGVRFDVTDTGIGIDPQDLPHIFDRFFTGDKSRAATRGPAHPDDHLSRSTGLGLAIAARIIESHGSRITVQSRPGAGSVFSFTLEIASESEGMRAAAAAD
jgi:signal transduction histidine kinase